MDYGKFDHKKHFRWYKCHGCGWEHLLDHVRNICPIPGCIGALHVHSNVDGELPKTLPRHNGGCSNQNAIHPAGSYEGVAECGCRYDAGAGIIQGPFKDCACSSHHQHGARGMAGCPVCAPRETVE